MPLELKLLNFEGEIQLIGEKNLVLPAQGMEEGVLFILLDINDLQEIKSVVEVGVFCNGIMIDK